MTQRFEGVVGRDWRDSTPWWPPEPTPPADAPNVLLIVLDDVGYAQLGCYGSDISTPTIDGLAAEGVRLANFHTTALCSPTRSCLLTGRNHHRNGMGRVADLAMGYPGYWGMIPRENGFLPEILRANGYATYAVGKWHLTPDDEVHMGASRASWPLGRGFDRWYGFHGGETHQFAPALYHDNHAVLAPGDYESGYHLSADLADRAIEFLSDLRAVDDGAAVLLLLRDGCVPLAAPRAAGMDRALQGPVRRGLGRVARRDVRAPARERSPAARYRAVAPSALGARVGRARAGRPGGRRALHGVLRRVPLVHRRADRPRARLPPRDRRPRQHTRRAVLRQRRELRRRRAGIDQRRAHVQRRDHRTARAARTHRRARRSDHAQQLSVGLDDGRQHAVQALEARGARRRCRGSVHHPPAAQRRPAPRTTAACATSSRTRSTCCRPCSSWPASRRPTWSTALRSHRSTARACSTRSPTPTHPNGTRRSTSRCSDRARSTTKGGRP